MQLWYLLRRDALRSIRPLILMAMLAGSVHVAVLTTMNEAIHRLTDADAVSQLLIMFLVANVLFILTQSQYMRMASGRIERAILTFRNRLVEEVAAAELADVGAIGHARITEALGNEFQTISQAVPMIVLGSHCLVVVTLSTLYIYTFSFETFLLLHLIVALHVYIAWRSGKRASKGGEESHDSVVELSDRVSNLMAGFREAKINRLRAERIAVGISGAAERAMNARLEANNAHVRTYTSAESVYYMSVAAVIFLLPAIASVEIDMVAMGANAISFVIYPLHVIIASLPVMQSAEVAAGRVQTVERRLAQAAQQRPAQPGTQDRREWPAPPQRIALEGLVFRHQGESGRRFTVGPVDLAVERGQVLFITGGNGSGKSTLVHMLLGLYRASHGRIAVDGRTVDANGIDAYRQLFSVVFSDNHLTREMLGVGAVDVALAEELIDLLELRGKVSIEDGSFSTVDLSGGQRKRLALIAALLEKRPVIVLDEWAADQSPQFRRTFYTKMIPWMQRRGMTVIAVTHDDRYFDVADRIIQVADGQISEIRADGLSELVPS